MPESGYDEVKASIMGAIKELKQQMPDAGAYLKKHIIFDDEAETFMYTGDDQLKISALIDVGATKSAE